MDGKEVEANKIYTLSTSDYLANGGGGFHMLGSLKRMDVNPVKLRDMIMQEIRQQTARGDSLKIEIANWITVSNE